jgi:uncharacterized protein (TIGR00251 family)
VGLHDDRLRIRLAAPPVDGAANDALIRLLAKRLGVPRHDLEIVAGAAGRRKTVFVKHLTLEDAARLLRPGEA